MRQCLALAAVAVATNAKVEKTPTTLAQQPKALGALASLAANLGKVPMSNLGLVGFQGPTLGT